MVSLPPAPTWARASFAFTPQLSPKTVSLPPSALITSLPSRPQIVSPAFVPVIVSLPLVAPKGKGAATPSQFSSTALPGISVAPGWIAGLLSLQSCSCGDPSPSASICVNVAVTERAALIDTWHVPVPEHPDPLQPVNAEPAAG